MLNPTETSHDDKRITCGKLIALFTDFFNNYMLVIISCCFCLWLLLLQKRLDQKRICIIILI